MVLTGRVQKFAWVEVDPTWSCRGQSCVPDTPIQLVHPFPYDFTVVLISLDVVEVISRWNSTTEKVPSLQGVAYVVVACDGQKPGEETPRFQHVVESLATFQSCDLTLHQILILQYLREKQASARDPHLLQEGS